MTIADTLVKFLETEGYGMFGQNIFLYRVPNSMKTEPELLWILPAGGQPTRVNKTGEKIKSYSFSIYFRSTSAKKVGDVLTDLEELLNCSSCVELPGFEVVGISTTQFPANPDLDAENRMVGFLQAEIQVYKNCNKNKG